MNRNYNIIPCFVEKKPKQDLKSMVSKYSLWFFTPSTISPTLFLNFVSQNPPLFSKTSPFEGHHHDSKLTRFPN